MTGTFLGRQIRFTDAVYERHLLDDGAVLWLGKSGLMENVMRMAAAGDMRIIRELFERMSLSQQQRRSVGWS